DHEDPGLLSLLRTDQAGDDDHPRRTGPLTVEEFARALIASGLMSAEGLRDLQARLSPTEQPGEPQHFAHRLVPAGKLTAYQASSLLEGKGAPLLLDRYIILDTLDTGGMGLVFKALHRKMERIVALKVLPSAAVDSPDKVRRFRREVRAAASLSH